MQEPNILLTILGKMATKPEVQFANLYPKLYNNKLWLMAYESIAPNPGNMTPGVDGETIDGMGMALVQEMIADLKASRYKPHPVRREYVPKPKGGVRPLGIPSFRDKLLQTVVRFILEAIYEPTFSETSHGFRPARSCHTVLEQVKRMQGIRWWVEGDIKGFFDNLQHDTLLRILSKRITDKRFLHLIKQFLEAGYIDNWQYHKTYSGVPQGGNLSPVLSNIYLNELDQMMTVQITAFNKGKKRQVTREYRQVRRQKQKAKQHGRQSGDWAAYKTLSDQLMRTLAADPQDPNFRRMYYVRYADDWLVGIIGSKEDAQAIKATLTEYLQTELQLELSADKTLITNAKERIRFLGYDIKRWKSHKRLRFHTAQGVITKRTCTYHLALLMPLDKCMAFARQYGNLASWQGTCRNNLIYLSELEILMTYNAEVRGFLEYYALADNLTEVASRILWLSTGSFLCTLARKRRSTRRKVAKSLKQGPNRFVVTLTTPKGTNKEYALVSSTKQLRRGSMTWKVDHKPNTMMYRARTELGQRLLAHECEWCETQDGKMEVHHVRKLADLKGKTVWEQQMIARRRKTMVLCNKCHHALHAGTLSESTKPREDRRAEIH